MSDVASPQQFGTLKGVYVPTLLTTLGVVMYLRMGWMVGHLGAFGTAVVITIGTAVAFVTALSIAAAVTNMRVGGGGAYFIISRSLGIEVGAAVGVAIFIAQALGVSFYVIGFAESLTHLFPFLNIPLVGAITLVLVALATTLSADFALKVQSLILLLIIASLISFFAGVPLPEGAVPAATSTKPETFWSVFAVFFPAVTGLVSGIALSGDLKDPARSLPIGVITAVLTAYGIYLAIPLVLAQRAPESVLLSDSLVMMQVSRVPALLVAGIWGASLSSAIGTLMAAPRTLEALAADHVVPRWLGGPIKGLSRGPGVAALVSMGIALCGIMLGNLNAIAPVLSMFFLTAFTILNFSTGIEGLIRAPSWRPRFKVHWSICLVGAVVSVMVMIMIDAGASIVALSFSALLFYLMLKRRMRAHWGDARHGIAVLIARYAVYALEDIKPNNRSWKPHFLALVGAPSNRWPLVEFASAISYGTGIITVASILPESSPPERLRKIRSTIKAFMRDRRTPCLVKVHTANNWVEGAVELVEAYGLGSLVPNTLVLGDFLPEEGQDDFVRLFRLALHRHRNLVILGLRPQDVEPRMPPKNGARIDVWWGRQRDNAGLMLALGYLLQLSRESGNVSLALKTIVDTEEEIVEAERWLRRFLETGRVEASIEAVVHRRGEDAFAAITRVSQDAERVFLGLRPPSNQESDAAYAAYFRTLMRRTETLPRATYVMTGEDIEFIKIFD